MSRIKLAIFFGGESEEREVSYMSAKNIVSNIDKNLYELTMIAFDKEDNPYMVDKLDASNLSELLGSKDSIGYTKLAEILKDIDVVFPLIHGPRGEDGELQGYLQKQNKDYVGCGISSSAICMDKKISKLCFKSLGINVVNHLDLSIHEYENNHINKESLLNRILERLNFPIFVKPANMGSSVGISKVDSREEILRAIDYAFKYDNHILLEQGVEARELECAVIGNYEAIPMSVGEILPSKDFYDYEAKYSSEFESGLQIPAEIPKILYEEIRYISKKVYEELGLSGFARVDFLYDEKNDKLYLNEINTLPGFTQYSMFPLLCRDSGIEYSQLINKLIQYAMVEK